jgi:hypothetical protein
VWLGLGKLCLTVVMTYLQPQALQVVKLHTPMSDSGDDLSNSSSGSDYNVSSIQL